MFQFKIIKFLTSIFQKDNNQKNFILPIILIIFFFIFFLSIGLNAEISIPPYLNYQGRLSKNTDGSNVNDVLTMTFSIYNSDTEDGAALYSQTKTVAVNNGLFSAVIGYGPGIYGEQAIKDGIPEEVFIENNRLYIGVKIGDNPWMRPRQRINSVAYAFKASYAEKAGEADNVKGQITVDSSSSNVGIGTLIPSEKLEVNGNIKAAGDIYESEERLIDKYAKKDELDWNQLKNIPSGFADGTDHVNDAVSNPSGTYNSMSVGYASNADKLDGYDASAFMGTKGCYVSYSGGCLSGFTNMGSAGSWGRCSTMGPGYSYCMFRPPGGGCFSPGWDSDSIGTAYVCCR